MSSVLGAGPFRRCVLTRTVLPKRQMVRLVIGPGRSLVPDLAGRLPGRGIWLSARGDVIETARVRGTLQRAIARAAGGAVAVPADLRERIASGLERRIAELLARAERAGRAASDRGKSGDRPAEAARARLADAVRTECGRLASLRGANRGEADTGRAGGPGADEGTGGAGA